MDRAAAMVFLVWGRSLGIVAQGMDIVGGRMNIVLW